MKKMLDFVCFVFATTICLCGQNYSSSYIAQSVRNAKALLLQEGITEKSVDAFIKNMEKITSSIPDNSDDRLFALKSLYKTEIDLVRHLLAYQTRPTEEDAKFLRSWANASTFWAEIIIPEMDKQLDPRYKFNKGSLENDD